MTVDPPKATLFVATLIMLAGYLLVFRPMEASIAGRYARLESDRATLERAIETNRRLASLDRDRRRLETQFERLHLRDSQTAAVVRFLQALDAVTRRDDVSIENVTVTALPGAGPRLPAPSAPAILDELPLAVTARGSYGDVIRVLRDLNGRDFAARIAVTSLLEAARRPGDRAQLQASFSVTLLRRDGAIDDDARTL